MTLFSDCFMFVRYYVRMKKKEVEKDVTPPELLYDDPEMEEWFHKQCQQ